ncbi:hypothetical protein ES705_15136 [subsurface metagenome]
MKDYDSDKDIEDEGGRYGPFLVDLILQRFSDCSDLKKGIMNIRLSGLEYEALQNQALLRQNN